MARLAMPNTFAARDRAFITRLAGDLHLSLAWDEFDEQDQNMVTFRVPSAALDSVVDGNSSNSDEDEWEDEGDATDAEAESAVDRVLMKYSKMKLTEDEQESNFDERYEKKVNEKMDTWKREYYRVSTCTSDLFRAKLRTPGRKNFTWTTMTPHKSASWCIDMQKDCSG
jgi:5'-3' exoribonuclease 1